MSVEKRYYVIGGYDLTRYRTDKYGDWMLSGEYDSFINNRFKNEIQIFDDPMDAMYLYFGKILHAADEYEFNPFMMEFSDIWLDQDNVRSKLIELINIGVVKENARSELLCPYKIIVFEECV